MYILRFFKNLWWATNFWVIHRTNGFEHIWEHRVTEYNQKPKFDPFLDAFPYKNIEAQNVKTVRNFVDSNSLEDKNLRTC